MCWMNGPKQSTVAAQLTWFIWTLWKRLIRYHMSDSWKTEIMWNLRWPIKMDIQFPDRTKTKNEGRVCYLWMVSCNQWHPPRVSTGPYTLRHIHKGPPRCTAKWLNQSCMRMTPRSTGEQTPQMDRIRCKRTWTHCTNSQKPGNHVYIWTSVKSCLWGIDHRMAYSNSICMQERKMAA